MDLTLEEIISHALKVVSICNLLSGIPGSIKMWKTGDTEGWPYLFFIIGLIGATGMTHYGLLTDNFTILSLNAMQVILNLYYILSYVCLTKLKAQSLRLLSGAVLYLVLLYSYGSYSQYDDRQMVNLLGSTSGTVFLVMNCVTVLDVVDAYKKQRAEFDLTMLSAGIINGVLWLTYGLLLSDFFIYVPTLPFLLTAAIKLVQMQLYKPRQKTE